MGRESAETWSNLTRYAFNYKAGGMIDVELTGKKTGWVLLWLLAEVLGGRVSVVIIQQPWEYMYL